MELPDKPPQLRRSSTADVCLGSDASISIEQGSTRVRFVKKSHPMPTPLPASTESTVDGVHTVATRTTVSMVPLQELLGEFPDSIAETISRELEKIIN